MAVTAYIYEGGTLTAAATQQGTPVPSFTKRIIKSASLVNSTTAPIAATVALVKADGTVTTHIVARPIAVGESYPCPELVSKGMNPGGYAQALGAGLTFDYTATDLV